MKIKEAIKQIIVRPKQVIYWSNFVNRRRKKVEYGDPVFALALEPATFKIRHWKYHNNSVLIRKHTL
jgi:hypothetical protein